LQVYHDSVYSTMSALLTTPDDLENVASHSKGARSTVTDLGLDDSSPEVEAQEVDQGSGTKPSSAVSQDQAINARPEVDTHPYIPTDFKIENHPVDARPQLKVSLPAFMMVLLESITDL
jgi:hypothetical protein